MSMSLKIATLYSEVDALFKRKRDLSMKAFSSMRPSITSEIEGIEQDIRSAYEAIQREVLGMIHDSNSVISDLLDEVSNLQKTVKDLKDSFDSLKGEANPLIDRLSDSASDYLSMKRDLVKSVDSFVSELKLASEKKLSEFQDEIKAMTEAKAADESLKLLTVLPPEEKKVRKPSTKRKK